ncbi:hypothetical protein CLAFUW4_09193 [Fulvia fulva]|uniref:Quinate/shikimate 5-dehydrogenase/glutamyl-tRNA reductase domain-containing protein n=1 Tax=Passalora fulva TaxID=5499 RepID=A0A9Q8PFP3_PASFU|nr:uncharacterized protein CLAFUR5_09293 [Fulvia fulva]KAK4613484.1 hypothetical protein CLAFUR4_09199 [Fulvia fulva]KAK4614943.1 hypothetical protein CLAFUR0_09191 [Fulvia fulva]UJO21557.1 hypothetical protein CLAFUR5_09293 [Fulvia fulva]WPV20706.1 hypothetical protein CLAFUW4_09193 [Fulvia fulva]WPV35686.1 hypothetical protein CLAFUW7_09194 [Fulvia fulva]
MIDCLVLRDSAVQDILAGLSRDEIITFQDAIGDSLKDYSVSNEREYQPDSGVVVRPNGQKVLWRPFTSSTSVGTKIIVNPAPRKEGEQLPLHGILTICDEQGLPTGIINAEEVTAFRTSMSALLPFRWRRRVGYIVVFGAGKQALWHSRLALAMRGSEVKSIIIVNRTKSRAQTLVDQLVEENQRSWKTQTEIDCLDPEAADYQSLLRERLMQADVVFCTVPSVKPVFAGEDIGNNKRPDQPLITAIGSWQSDMIELDPALLRRVVDSGGKVVVDDVKTCIHHSGEIVRAKLEKEQLVEIGELLDTKGKSSSSARDHWFEDGLFVYKSIGVSLTDLISGNEILRIARKKNVGISIPDF